MGTGRKQIMCLFSFFFNDTTTTEIYTLSLHDALPISADPDRGRPRVRRVHGPPLPRGPARPGPPGVARGGRERLDRKSTRLNSSHANISYAVFCLKKKTFTNSPTFSRSTSLESPSR